MGVGGSELPAPALARLDPNARYSTTYRPGSASLSAFDSTVGRGGIPSALKDLVGDFGARYAPEIARPATAALSFKIDAERALSAPEGGLLNLRIALRSSERNAARAQLSVHLVLDVSGSMQGAAIQNARQAAATLVRQLQPTDDFSLVTFSSEAQVLVSDGPVGPRRGEILQKIEGVKAEGGTNISAGLDLGYTQARSTRIAPDAVRMVMLLSDGHANSGDTSRPSLANRSERAFQDGIQTSAFGLGSSYDSALMASLADRGAGGYYYLAESSQIAVALSHELRARLVPVAQAVEVRLRLRNEVIPIKVFGSHALDGAEAAAVRAQEIAWDKHLAEKSGIKRDRRENAEGGMRFFIPSFARDDRHAMLITVKLPPGVGEREIASVEIKYKDRLHDKNVTEEVPVRVRYAATTAESAASTDATIAVATQAFLGGETILRAVEHVDAGDRAGAARILDERAELLRHAGKSLNDPRLAEDADRLIRLSRATSGTEQITEGLPLAAMLRGAGQGYLR